MQDRYVNTERIVLRKINKVAQRKLLSSPWHRGTRCLQHASVMILLLTITLHCLAFAVRWYIPELLLDELDALTDNDTDFMEYNIKIGNLRPDPVAEGPTPLLERKPAFSFPPERTKPIQGWRKAILDFLGSMLWLTHNQVTVDTKRTQFPSGRH